ncbi:hypothetical protein ACIRBX_25545 [Kitasatospora sp. NPDC096147]|uniref:hypothetical protein n=1 Tax=Kitasatospora sp. NPDC096147 TaxID=3364093 RepID=UPI0038050DEC
MLLGPSAPTVTVLETLTGSAFGVQLIAGELPFFCPYGWDPELGLDAAIDMLGWRCDHTSGGTAAEAVERLRRACSDGGPVLAGPVDMGLLLYQPGTPNAEGGDHYVVVLEVDDDTVLLHDPHGHPYATLPVADFVAAWEAKSVAYTDQPYGMRSGFVREREVGAAEALRASLPGAVRWLTGRRELPMPPGSLGGAAALEALADRVEAEGGLPAGVRDLLQHFGVRVGVRRLADAAACLDGPGLSRAAAEAAGQARLLGALQHPVVVGDTTAVAAGLRRLAPGYDRLRSALEAAIA